MPVTRARLWARVTLVVVCAALAALLISQADGVSRDRLMTGALLGAAGAMAGLTWRIVQRSRRGRRPRG